MTTINDLLDDTDRPGAHGDWLDIRRTLAKGPRWSEQPMDRRQRVAGLPLLRQAARLTQHQLAAELEVDTGAISRLETGGHAYTEEHPKTAVLRKWMQEQEARFLAKIETLAVIEAWNEAPPETVEEGIRAFIEELYETTGERR